MILSVGCTLGYEVQFPTANFTSNILANRDPFQHVVDEGIRLTADLAIGERTATSKGNRVFRVEAPAGMFEVTYRAMMEVRRPSVPAEVRIDKSGRLPLSIPTYMLSNGYCESDRFNRRTWASSEKFQTVRIRCARFAGGWMRSSSIRRARRTRELRRGTCGNSRGAGVATTRDLAIALCRALKIPTRSVGCYAVGLEPMDFRAYFSAWLGGPWHLFDPTDQIDPSHIAVIARGRDAAKAALTTIFGEGEHRAAEGAVHGGADAGGAGYSGVKGDG